jgi:hypothetical protein
MCLTDVILVSYTHIYTYMHGQVQAHIDTCMYSHLVVCVCTYATAYLQPIGKEGANITAPQIAYSFPWKSVTLPVNGTYYSSKAVCPNVYHHPSNMSPPKRTKLSHFLVEIQLHRWVLRSS